MLAPWTLKSCNVNHAFIVSSIRANPKLHEIKFNSTNKWQLSIHKPDGAGAGTPPLMVLKGAPERVIRMCTKMLIQGKEVPLTRELFDQFNQVRLEEGGGGPMAGHPAL